MDQDNGGVVSRPRNRTTVCVGQFNITKESSGEKLDIRHSLRSVFLVPGHFSGKVLLGCIECEIWFSAFGGLVSRSKVLFFSSGVGGSHSVSLD